MPNISWRLLDVRLSQGEHPMVQPRVDLLQFSILRQPEPPHEAATSGFNTVPHALLFSSSTCTFTSSFLTPAAIIAQGLEIRH